jgi:protein-S-isoprenylcysteine O-methyltransferase Ste14
MPAMMPASETDSPRVVALPPLLYAGAIAVSFVARWVSPQPMLAPSLRYWCAWPLLAVGVALAAWGRRALVSAGTHVDPRKPATALVAAGPYRFSRNPLYVALTLIYLSITCFANDIWFLPVLLVLLAVMQYGVIHREERYLEAKFGDSYRDYCARVRRWL